MPSVRTATEKIKIDKLLKDGWQKRVPSLEELEETEKSSAFRPSFSNYS